MKTRFDAVKFYLMLPLYLLIYLCKICAKHFKQKAKPVLALLVAAVIIFSSLPLTVFAADNIGSFYNRVVDVNTMDNWNKYFDIENPSTKNAGGVWTDKSVFKDASAFDGKVSMLNSEENFLTALSAIAANKEVVGYSTVPTDTVLVLDLSGSMENSDSEEDLIKAANNAIGELLAVNDNNRVGVVLYSASDETGSSTYSESVTRILPIDRYTTDTDGIYLRLNTFNGNVSVDGDVEGTVANADLDNTKSFGGGTYIQAGLWEAMKMFKEMDTVIGDNNWQSGDNRMPILVLMSDGAPSTGTSYYADVENSYYTTGGGLGGTQTVYESNVGNGNESNLLAGNAFLTQLTASYVMNQIETHYQQKNSDVRGLFYTLGFNIGTNNVAQSVMNPDNSTYTDSLWNTYNRLTAGSMSVRVKNRNGNQSDVSITKNSYATSKSYVDEYFSASGNGLNTAFESIVEEIILQSRYYPTHLEGGSPDFSGYVEFKDTLGEYMEVKDIKGILLGDTLYDGHMMASKLSSNSSDGLGTVENPTDLGDEFIRAVKTRLGIAETAVAQELVADAFAAGQLKYNSATDWSNYIAWYAKADGTYAGFWDEKSTSSAPADAVYKIKSYGFLGETTGSIKNSDMMYMSVQVRTNIATGQQTMLWKIPAALVPMVTYLVTLDGINVDKAENVNVTVENKDSISPIRLVFESGLRSDLNELNITRITDSKHIAEDGVTRQFWTNYFDISAPEHDDHITTMAEFTPSKENERFYYTFDSAVHKRVGNGYVLVEENETLNQDGEYYHRRYIFTNNEDKKPIFLYERMSSASIRAAVWKDNFETLTGEKGAYVVPAGTPARELTMYDEQKSTTDNIDTKSAEMVFHPYLTEQNNMVYIDMNLGNNGLLEVTPAQGIKLSKTIDIYESGTSTDFSFRITVHNANGTSYTGALESYITDLDVVPTGDATTIQMSSTGTYIANLSRNQTLWLTGLPTGATYTIEEISDNSDYKVKSVHVNGTSTGTIASGTIAAYFIDDVDFVNTAVGEGDLVITKQVVDDNGSPVDINDSVTFTAEVTLTDKSGNPLSGTFKATNAAGEITIPSSGEFTVRLKEGETFAVRGLPERTEYSVVETQIPQGFGFNESRSSMQGIIDAEGNDQALIVNTYKPVGTDGEDVKVNVTKQISGNRTNWLNRESYSFKVTGPNGTINVFTIDNNDADKIYTLDLKNEPYNTAGTYRYTITELSGNQKGITYDTVDRRFAVVVADSDMDGDLEITAVNNEANTTVTKSGNVYTVAANFENVYAPTDTATVEIDVIKKMVGEYRLNGFQFALYNANPITDANAEEVLKSTVTDASGNAKFTWTYPPHLATATGTVYTYYLAEINTGNPNIDYSKAVYKVEVTLTDNGDGTTSATPKITSVPDDELVNDAPVFTNVFTPSEEAYVTLTANKSIVGERVLNSNEFEFVIEALTVGAPLPNETAVKNAANGAVVFDAIEFTAVGTYKYKIYEKQDNKIGGFDYDARFYEVTVVVTDRGDRKLYASVTRVVKVNENDTGRTLRDDEIMTFTNTYSATPATVKLEGEKLLTGKKLLNNEFNFVLTPADVNNPMPSNSTVKNDANGKFAFGDITFTKAGVYTYTLTETDEGKVGYDYDESVYDITVTVTDNSQGRLSARVDMKRNNITSTAIVFRNGFTPTPLELDIYDLFGGEKVLEGRDLIAGEFEFKLMNAITGVQIGDTVKSDANGKFAFTKVKLPDEGEYHFRISEIVGAEKGVTYDTSIYHIFVKVAKDEEGDLSISEKKLYKGTVTKKEVGGVLTEVVNYNEVPDGEKMVFNNSYKADPAYVTLEATKLLSGRDLIDGEFKFDLHKTDAGFNYNQDTVIQDDVVLTLNDDGTGNVRFMPMEFNAEGDYFYVIVEDEPANDKGVTSDDTAYEVRITVTDNNKGNLIAKIFVDREPITSDISDTVKFHNYYKAAATEIVIEGTKKLEGRNIKADEFSFELYDSDNQKLETVKNTVDGKFVFSAIPVEAAGEYVYTVRELNDRQENITYDETVYTVTVTVTDNLDGTFKLEYAYADGEAEVKEMTFVNTYSKPVPEPKPKNEPETITVPEPEPEQKSPQTGDNSNSWLWFALAFVSGCGVFSAAVYSKKEETQEN